MTIEIGQVVIAACLLLAVLFRSLHLATARGRWHVLSASTRWAAIAALAVTLALIAVVHGQWSPFDPRQIPLSLALATLVIHEAVCRRFRVDTASITLDLAALGFVLAGALATSPGKQALLCAQQVRYSPFFWIPFFLGVGGITVAGSAGLGSIVHHVWVNLRGSVHQPESTSSDVLLAQSTNLALVFLGSGLALSTWSAWHSAGDLTSCDPREAWMALAWLVTATGSLARFLERGWRRWTAGLAVLAAAVALFGLLGLTDVRSLLGM
jgi:hypothetical protein